MNLKLSKYTCISEPLDANDDLRTERIVFSTRTGKGIKVTNYVIGLVSTGAFESIPDRLFTIFMYHEIIVPEDEDEQDLVIKRKLLTAQDIQKRKNSILVRDTAQTQKDISAGEWIPGPVGQSADANHSITCVIDNPERGMDNFLALHQKLAAVDAGDVYDYQLLVLDPEPGNIINYLPLETALFHSVVFCFIYEPGANTSGRLQQYASSLATLVKRLPYMRKLPVTCWFFMKQADEKVLQPAIKYLKELSAHPNIKINFDTGQINNGKNEKQHIENELGFMINLQQESVKSSFLPAISCKYIPAAAHHAAASLNAVVNLGSSCQTDNEWDSYDVLQLAKTKENNPLRLFYDEAFAEQLRKNKTVCGSCIYLPMCGGIDKKPDDITGCPSFTRNFMKKVEYMYQFSLQKPVE